MASFISRRDSTWHSALLFTAMFGTAVVVSLLVGGVPTWQNHGEDAGPGMIWRTIDPTGYYIFTGVYAAVAVGSLLLAFFRLPWISIGHIRILFVVLFLGILALPLYSLRMVHMNRDKERSAWNRIEELGGHGVWDNDMIVASLADTHVSDEDLSLFADFPHVQILDLSRTQLTDKALQHLEHLRDLETLILVETKITQSSIETFRAAHPSVTIETEPVSEDTINPFTGEPFSKDTN